MSKSKRIKSKVKKSVKKPIQAVREGSSLNIDNKPKEQINILAWGACPWVITGFGVVMREILENLYRQYPGVYNIHQVAINFQGQPCDEDEITGGRQNGRHIQWPAAVSLPGGRTNLYGQPKLLEVLRNSNIDYDLIFLFEDPFWIGGIIPGSDPQVYFVDAIKKELANRGTPYTPIVAYFPIDGIPKPVWIQNIAKADLPVTYLNFGASACLGLVPELTGKIGVINHGVNTKHFYPIPKEEARSFKRAMFGDRLADSFMLLNVNRNQARKMLPSMLIGFKEFKKKVPNSFIYMNMKSVDVGWNLIEVCRTLGLEIGKDVMFPPDFNVQKGLSLEDLNKLFNCADVLATSAIGGGWELALTQAFATKTTVLAPSNTSHVELCGDQTDPDTRRGVLYKSGSNLSQVVVMPHDNEVLRPMPDTDDMVKKLQWIYDNQDVCRRIEDNSYKWVNDSILWDKHVVHRFNNLFTAAKALKKQRLHEAEVLKSRSIEHNKAIVEANASLDAVVNKQSTITDKSTAQCGITAGSITVEEE